jgi:polysaccharide export outer membrane protein
MNLAIARPFVIFSVFLCWSLPARGAEADKTHRNLIEYIQNAQKLGLKESEIKKNAVKAGWDQGSVEDALKIVAYLNTTGRASKSANSGSAPKLTPNGSDSLPEGYRIGAGDTIGVLVWKEPDASIAETVVRADGKITMPLLKEVEAAGLTPTELEKQLADKLASFINGPDVTVIVREIVSRKIYMIGAVKREGPILLEAPKTILQAITEAGGLTDYAKRKKIYVLRDQNGKQVRLAFDYNAVIKGEHLEQNITVQPGDSIVVPQ